LKYSRSDAILFIYDITNRDSFLSLSNYINNLTELLKNNINKPIIGLIGNKLDLILKREVEKEEAEKFAKENEISLFMECSAKNSTNISEIFNCIIEMTNY
jgi:Ras-related protein Rab-5C